MRKVGEIVFDIHKCETSDEALLLYGDEIIERGLSLTWLASVFKNKKGIPILDSTYDVHGKGVDVLTVMGISTDAQTSMWIKWGGLDEDIRAAWINDFKKVDQNEVQDLFSFTELLIKLLS